MNKALLSSIAICAGILFSSCSGKEGDEILVTDNTPSTYTFTRNGESTVSYGGQLDRINMLDELGSALSAVNSTGGTIDATAIKAMFANNGATWTGTYDATKNLKGKTATAADATFFDNMIDEMATVATSGAIATNGTAGLALKTGSTSGYLVNENGLEYRQIIIKRMMGSVFYSQAIENYLGTELLADDNTTIAEGKTYTTMEHHFDEAFGYMGIATNLTNNDLDTKDKSKGMFWGEYLIKRTGAANYTLQGGNEKMLNAFIKGRNSIVNKNIPALQEAVLEISNTWELIMGLNAIDYLDVSKTDTDPAARLHHLSEAIGFLLSLEYHYETGSNAMHPRLSNLSKVQDVLNIVGLTSNLHTLSNTDLDNAITKLNDAFNGALVK